MCNALQPDSIFVGRYRIVRCVAHGGMAAIHEVIHLETDRRCALKIVHEHMLQDHAILRRFRREAKIATRVHSDSIVDVFDAGVDPVTQRPFLVMELLRGEELGRRIKRLGALAREEALTYLEQTALALDKTHKAGVVHRDLKPENLFLAEGDGGPPRIKLLDFGVAKVLSDAQASASTTLNAGTPRYMAPEQFDPDAAITGAADLYALALIAYTCLVGQPYWCDEARTGNIFAFAAIARLGPRVAPSARAAQQHGVELPAGFDAWFAKAAHVDPSQRYASPTAAVDALRHVLKAREPDALLSLPALAPVRRRWRGRPLRSRFAVAALGLAAVLFVLTAALGRAGVVYATMRSSSASRASVGDAALPSWSQAPPRARSDGRPARPGALATSESAAAAFADVAIANGAAADAPAEAAASRPAAPAPTEAAARRSPAPTPTEAAPAPRVAAPNVEANDGAESNNSLAVRAGSVSLPAVKTMKRYTQE